MFAITWKEIQKNLFVISAYLVLIVLTVLAYNNYLPGVFDEQLEMLATNYSFMLGIMVNMVVFGGLMANEKEEEQSNGYEFMQTLPIESWKIVGGKFFSAFFSAILAILSIVLVTMVFGTKLESKLMPIAYTLLSSSVALLLVGVLYLFAFRTRYSKLLPIVLITYIGAMMVPQAGHLLMLIAGWETTVEQLFSSLTLLTGTLIFSACVIIFTVIGYFAVRVKKKVPVPL